MNHPFTDDTHTPLYCRYEVESIDLPQTLTEAIVEQISVHYARIGFKARRELQRHFINVAFPLLLLISVVWMVLTYQPIDQVYKVSHGIKTMLNPTYMDLILTLTGINFKNIRKMDDIPTWINGTVIPAVFTYYMVDGKEYHFVAISNNNQVGAMEISVFNRKQEDCKSNNLLAYGYGRFYDFES
ncbi:hypothetical protein THRCLA_22061 [Thraustotheca clavata]|uniref:Uncharacterized protein n=1 Tax=Thraustotheca clavata TaxID=74557 RepID=A0A1V9ZD01_9STRA|nr:hypothetical protein THRCLA_22061 [Thraustotheca clavata]